MLPISIPEAITSLMFYYLRKQLLGDSVNKRPYCVSSEEESTHTQGRRITLQSA